MQFKFYFLSVALLPFYTCQLYAQSPTLTWQHCYGGPFDEIAYAVTNHTDGSVFVAGSTTGAGDDVSGHHGGSDGWVFKSSETGELQWQLCLGTAYHEWMTGILPLPDGGCIVSGLGVSYPGGNNDCGGSFAFEDFWLLRLSASGDITWQQCYGGSNQDIPRALARSTDGSFYMAGFTYSDDGDVNEQHGGTDAWVIKTEANGDLSWTIALGGSGNEDAVSIIGTADGGCIVTGISRSDDGDVHANYGGNDVWIVKLTASGAISWSQNFGGSEHDSGAKVLPLPEGGYLVASNTRSNDQDVSGLHGESDIWIFKLNENGELLWQKCFGGTEGDFARDILALPNSNFIITGEAASEDGDLTSNYGAYDFWLFEIDPIGNLIWQKSFGGSNYDYPKAIQLLPNGELLLAGETLSNDHDISGNHGAYDAWLGRFSSLPSATTEIYSMHKTKVFPNPTSATISMHYELAGNSNVCISLIDHTGKNLGVFFEDLQKTGFVHFQLALPNTLPSGMYWISLQTRYGMEMVRVVVN